MVHVSNQEQKGDGIYAISFLFSHKTRIPLRVVMESKKTPADVALSWNLDTNKEVR